MEKIIIYTDGGCRGNPGLGGWGVWLRYKGHDKKLKGAAPCTTNNQMELTAAIEALQAIQVDNVDVDLYTDSKYVVQGIREWIKSWKLKSWKTASKKPVKNIELWKLLDKLNQKYVVTWHWVKGHSGDEGNDIADDLANQAMDEFASNHE